MLSCFSYGFHLATTFYHVANETPTLHFSVAAEGSTSTLMMEGSFAEWYTLSVAL
jgi:hypothetical protein